jgi:hypothetical protein
MGIEDIKRELGEQMIEEDEDIKTTPDGLPTLKEQLRLLDEEDNKHLLKLLNPEYKEKVKKRELIDMIKTVCLPKMGKNPLFDTSRLNLRDRNKLIKLMEDYTDKNEDELRKEFNEVCIEYIFENPSLDYTKFPIYNI